MAEDETQPHLDGKQEVRSHPEGAGRDPRPKLGDPGIRGGEHLVGDGEGDEGDHSPDGDERTGADAHPWTSVTSPNGVVRLRGNPVPEGFTRPGAVGPVLDPVRPGGAAGRCERQPPRPRAT